MENGHSPRLGEHPPAIEKPYKNGATTETPGIKSVEMIEAAKVEKHLNGHQTKVELGDKN